MGRPQHSQNPPPAPYHHGVEVHCPHCGAAIAVRNGLIGSPLVHATRLRMNGGGTFADCRRCGTKSIIKPPEESHWGNHEGTKDTK